MSTGKLIKFLRLRKGLTQAELSEILGVTKNSIQKYESDDVPNIKTETLRKICLYFGIAAEFLVFPEEFEKYDIEVLLPRQKELKAHIRHVSFLNDKGIQKVFDYAKDLHDSGNYVRSQHKST